MPHTGRQRADRRLLLAATPHARALGALLLAPVGKDTVSRVWRKVKSDWDAWNAGSIYAATRERIETRRNAFIRK